MYKNIFQQPEVIGEIEPDFFDNIKSICPNPTTSIKASAFEHNPAHDKVLDYVSPLLAMAGSAVRCTYPELVFDQRPVAPGAIQRTSGWHVDSPGQTTISVANELTTKFLVSDGSCLKKFRQTKFARKIIMDREKFLAQNPNFIEDLGFRVFRAEPNQVVLFRNQIHIPGRNHTDQVINRNWLSLRVDRYPLYARA